MSLIINGQAIDENLLEQEFSNIKASYERLSPYHGCCERDEEFRGYAKRNIIGRVLLAQQAEQDIDPISEEELDEAIAQLKQEHGGEEQFFAAAGITPDQEPMLRGDIAANMRVRKLIDRVCADIKVPDDARLRKYYEANVERYMTDERVRASHILRSPKRGEDRAPAYEQLREARRRILSGETFETVAREISDKVRELEEATEEQKAKAGDPVDLGYFKRGELMEEFEIVAFSMEVDEVSPVFNSPFGMHLVKLTERESAMPKPFDEMRDAVAEDYLVEHRDQRIQAHVDQLKAQAKIEGEEECGGGCGCSHE